MATDNESLVLSISADTRQIQRQLKQLIGQTERDTKSIENAFGGIDKAATGAFGRVAANGNAAFTTAEQGAKRFGAAMSASKVQTANLAAQLNDISVQLAGGQSPFQIALQQGTQITQALGSGTGVRGAVAAVGGAFTSLLNPVSLATIAIIALGGTAIQYFSELLSSGEKTEETLQKQAQLIQQVADRWGDAVPALREYANELKRAQESASLREGVEIVKEKTLSEVRDAIDGINIDVADLVSKLQSAGAETETIVGLQRAFNSFSTAAKEGKLNAEDVQKVSEALAATLSSSGIPAVDEFSAQFDKLAGSALNASNKIRQLELDAVRAVQLDPRNWRGMDPSTGRPLSGLSADEPIQGGEFNLPEDGPTPGRRPLIELEGLPSSRGGRRSKAISEAEREKKAVAELIEQLKFEQSALSMTNEERAVANALRRAGTVATPEQRIEIERLVEATYAERDAIRANKEAMEELQDISRDVLEGLVSDLKEGKSGADILASALGRIGDRLVSAGFDALFSNAGPGTSGKALFGTHFTPNLRSIR
jgi:hypothetical protein